MALERREIEHPQLPAQPGECAAIVGRMIDQIGHDAAGRRSRQEPLRLGPVSPVVAQDRLLRLDRRAVERVRPPPSPASGRARGRRAATPGRRTRPRIPPNRTVDRQSSWAARPGGCPRSRQRRSSSSSACRSRSTSSNRLPSEAAVSYTAGPSRPDRLELELGRAHAADQDHRRSSGTGSWRHAGPSGRHS